MRRWAFAAGILFVGTMAFGYIVNPPSIRPLYQRVAWSDLIVVAKVTQIEEKPARDDELPGQRKRWYTRVARLDVSEVLLGPVKIESVRLAVNPMWMKPPASWSDYDRMFGKGKVPKDTPRVQSLEKGRVGIFFLSRRDPGKVYVPADHPIFTDEEDPAYKAELKRCKRLVRLLADPKTSLRSREHADRRATASMLLWRYCADRYGTNKTESIDAEESKLILGVLADSKWGKTAEDPDEAPMRILYGWVSPLLDTGSESPRPRLSEAERKKVSAGDDTPIQDWVRKHRETFRIKRHVWDVRKK